MEFVSGREVEDDGGDGPWTDVNYNKQKKVRGNGVELTFIVQNLSDRASRTILKKAFQPFGFVSDVYVARKKDKRGNYFGFVRFVGIENVDSALEVMNTVIILEAKVSVSLAKYDKNHKKFIYTSKVVGDKVWRQKVPSNTAPPNNNGYDFRGATVQDGKSFASLFQSGGLESNSGSFSGAKTLSIPIKGAKYPLHCISRSIHGVAHDVEVLNNLNSALKKEGLCNFGLSYIGGLSVLLTLGSPELVKDVMISHSVSLSKVFSRFHVWKGEDLPLDRIVYLRISGVPVHLRDNAVYDDIGGLFGKVVQGSSFSWTDSDNSECSVLVLVPLGKRIEESIVITWEQRRFVVWVVEDVDAWRPDGDDDATVGNLDNDPMGDEVGQSAARKEEDQNMVDEVEDGEFRSPEANVPSPEKVDRPSPVGQDENHVEPQKISGHENSPSFEKLDNEQFLHEEHGGVHGDGSNPRNLNIIMRGIMLWRLE
ncbi:uncharacterized protein LOC110876568 [Helianthus annuus]|uniref:uncharacterized protein LOC110876568 n=1 Tax=Helianthus annuus TaxID=4232 RepID=UPI000B900C26|nr:uncharacterized protein LOC110876568 [Helianthus annuus]